MDYQPHRNQGVLGTFLTGALAIITGFILLTYVPMVLPWFAIIFVTLWIIYVIVAPHMRKETQRMAEQVKDDD